MEILIACEESQRVTLKLREGMNHIHAYGLED